ncbi:MAG: hypothetical protein WBZ36_30040 [Candidatus Nitrosopolaris sp.]
MNKVLKQMGFKVMVSLPLSSSWQLSTQQRQALVALQINMDNFMHANLLGRGKI